MAGISELDASKLRGPGSGQAIRREGADLFAPARNGDVASTRQGGESDSDYLRRLADRLAPPKVIAGFFPNDGAREPMPAGRTVIDFVNWVVQSPAARFDLNGFQKAAQGSPLRSFLVVVDVGLTLELTPTTPGRFVMGPTVLEGDIMDFEQVVLTADVPFALNLVAGTSLNQMDVRVFGFWQHRYNASTLTKTAVAGTADSYTNVLWVPYEGTKTLTVATWGDARLFVMGACRKSMRISNTGSNPADFQLQGSIIPAVSVATGFVADPEVPEFTLLAGEDRMISTSLPWGVMRLRARASASVTAAATTTIICESAAEFMS